MAQEFFCGKKFVMDKYGIFVTLSMTNTNDIGIKKSKSLGPWNPYGIWGQPWR